MQLLSNHWGLVHTKYDKEQIEFFLGRIIEDYEFEYLKKSLIAAVEEALQKSLKVLSESLEQGDDIV